MKVTFRTKLGALLLDLPRYLFLFVLGKLSKKNYWLRFKNRRENISVSLENGGVMCHWPWTSELHLANIIPMTARHLFKQNIQYAPIGLDPSGAAIGDAPQLSFIIGHRGLERLPLLINTLHSIAAQGNCVIECIVVEQSSTPTIENELPEWVRFYHQEVPENQPYSRSMAFNFGAQKARAEYIILHDNDLLVPSCYASQHLSWHQQGYMFVNLKRFIFYLSEASTQNYLLHHDKNKLHFESIVQNAQGGGSISAIKKAYFEIGGFDEQFIGWGGEDNEFWERAQTMRTWSYANLPLIHLWHSAQPEKNKDGAGRNKQLYEKLARLAPSARIKTLTKTNFKR